MIAEKNPEVKKAYAELKLLSQDEKNQLIYEAREKALRDERARLKTVTWQGKISVAEQMLNDNMDISMIMKYTGLSKEDILAINTTAQ